MSSFDATCCGMDESILVRESKYVIHDEAEKGTYESMKALLDRVDELIIELGYSGSDSKYRDINARDNTECTPLHTAILYKNFETLRQLVERGVKLNVKCNQTPTPHIVLTMGSIQSNTDFVNAALDLLLSKDVNCNFNLTDDMGRSVYHIIAMYGKASWLEKILTTKTEPLPINSVDKQNRTALHYACEFQNVDVFNFLMAHPDVDLTIVDKSGNTAAHTAAKSGWTYASELLVGRMQNESSHNNANLRVEDLMTGISLPVPSENSTSETFSSKLMEMDSKVRTLIMTHPDCMHHHTCLPFNRSLENYPPENNQRLDVLLHPINGTLRSSLISERSTLMNCAPLARLSDVLRVHDYEYIRKVLTKCGQADQRADAPGGAGLSILDGDTVISRATWTSALRAAGAVCYAIDSVMTGRYKNAFCAVRPPGHHAGPRGIVTNSKDMEGSHGFCILNNVAVGAAYLMSNYGRSSSGGIPAYLPSSGVTTPVFGKRIAILDFDVHHGNGTEAILQNLVPNLVTDSIALPMGKMSLSVNTCKPWLDTDDGASVMFVSTHGYGAKRDTEGDIIPNANFYPSSGENRGWKPSHVNQVLVEAGLGPVEPSFGPDPSDSSCACVRSTVLSGAHVDSESDMGASTNCKCTSIQCNQCSCVPAEPLLEQQCVRPSILNYAVDHEHNSKVWRRVLQLELLPRIEEFKPDIILLSAGFDAHRADLINSGYLKLVEDDYSWLTSKVVALANRCCEGRVVSVLEGGYKVQGRIVSAFGRSVAAHVRTLAWGSKEVFDSEKEKEMLLAELRVEAASRVPVPSSLSSPSVAASSGSNLDSSAIATLTSVESVHHLQRNVDVSATPLTPGNTHTVDSPAGSARSKRRRSQVDYVALDAQMRKSSSDSPAVLSANSATDDVIMTKSVETSTTDASNADVGVSKMEL